MSTNNDKREFEFIEHPVSPNKHNSSCSSSTIVKMWVLLEGSPDPEELKADITHVTNLNDFKDVLIKEFDDVLKNTKKRNIVFLDNNSPLQPDTDLQTLAKISTAKKPLVVRYPISSVNLKVTFVYGKKQGKREIPHTSDSFNQLEALVREIFEDLEEGTIYFVNDGTEIWNAYNFNNVIKSQTAQDGNSITLRLTIKVKGRRKYSDWRLSDVLRDILGKPNCKAISQIPRFDVTELPKLDPPFTQDELKIFLGELRNTLKSFDEEFDNETKNRVYINAFMKTAVCYLRDTKKKSVLLDVEKLLSGSKGYGPIDYWVTFIEVLLLLCEAKAEDMNQGIAQVIVQMHSAIEQLENCNKKLTIYGIATTGRTWRFVRWVGSTEKPTVCVSKEYNCSYTDNMEREKEVLEYIAQILQSQAESVCNDEDSHPSKRQCTSQRK